MNQIFNQYSALWIAAAFILLAVLFVFRRKPKASDLVALGVVVAGLALAWMTLYPRQTPLMEDAKRVQDMIGQSVPVLLEFQSPY
jgi:hypothetical protein